jgi:DinB family protein
MKFIATCVLAGALWLIPIVGQEFKGSANPVTDAVRRLLARDSKNLVASAELLPAEKYGYHPTPAQMTFGQLIVHIVQTNVALCSGASGMPVPEARYPSLPMEQLEKLADTASKDVLVGAIKQSFEYCTEALAKVNDAQLGEEATIFGRRTGSSRADALITIAADWADHYSTAASYLRLNGILPPTAQPKK